MQRRSSQLKTQHVYICKKKANLFIISFLIFPGYISDQFNDQLPVGLQALWLDTAPVLHKSGFESQQAFFFSGFLVVTA